MRWLTLCAEKILFPEKRTNKNKPSDLGDGDNHGKRRHWATVHGLQTLQQQMYAQMRKFPFFRQPSEPTSGDIVAWLRQNLRHYISRILNISLIWKASMNFPSLLFPPSHSFPNLACTKSSPAAALFQFSLLWNATTIGWKFVRSVNAIYSVWRRNVCASYGFLFVVKSFATHDSTFWESDFFSSQL